MSEERLLFLTNEPGKFLLGQIVDGYRITGLFEADPSTVTRMIGRMTEVCYEVWGLRVAPCDLRVGPTEFKE